MQCDNAKYNSIRGLGRRYKDAFGTLPLMNMSPLFRLMTDKHLSCCSFLDVSAILRRALRGAGPGGRVLVVSVSP